LNDHTLDAALQFLDEIIFVIFEVLPEVVFANPQVLPDKVTKLVEARGKHSLSRKFKDMLSFLP
jgi:hypothetical protein